MFGFGLKSKTEKVLLDHFSYPVSNLKRHVFNALVKQGKSMGQNEYSIAIYYMMINMNTLVEPWDDSEYENSESEQKEINDFIERNGRIIGQIMHLANSPESDIEEMLLEIIVKSGMANPDNRPVEVMENPKDSSKDSKEVAEESEEIEKIEESDEDDDENLDVQDGEDDKGMEFLRKMADLYVGNLKIFISLAPKNTGTLSDYQIKFIFALQLLGAIDYCGQLRNLGEDKCSPIYLVKLLDKELFDWNPSEAGFVFHAVIDVQEEQWAQKIIISGGESMAEILDNSVSLANNTMDENVDLFPMTKIFDDNEAMKLVAKNVQPPF